MVYTSSSCSVRRIFERVYGLRLSDFQVDSTVSNEAGVGRRLWLAAVAERHKDIRKGKYCRTTLPSALAATSTLHSRQSQDNVVHGGNMNPHDVEGIAELLRENKCSRGLTVSTRRT